MSISTGGKLANGGKKSGQILAPTIQGTDGNDVVDFSAAGASAAFNGGRGNDVIKGGALGETLSGDDGNDWINGGGGNDTLDGGAGTDWLSFQLGAYVDGVTADLGAGTYTDAAFSASTSTGFENVWGSEGDDILTGSTDANEIIGALGNDVIDGQEGNDNLQGNDGDDEIVGGEGDDAIDGGDDSDTIEGGEGADTLTGGDGDDTFVFGADADTNGVDVIVDFEAATYFDDAVIGGDLLDLSAALAAALAAENGIDQSNIAEYVQIVDGELRIDADGAAEGQAVLFADLSAILAGDEVRVLLGSAEYSVEASETLPPPPPPAEPEITGAELSATDSNATEPTATEPAATEPAATDTTEPAATAAEPTPDEASDTGSGFEAPATNSFDTSSLDSGFVNYI